MQVLDHLDDQPLDWKAYLMCVTMSPVLLDGLGVLRNPLRRGYVHGLTTIQPYKYDSHQYRVKSQRGRYHRRSVSSLPGVDPYVES